MNRAEHDFYHKLAHQLVILRVLCKDHESNTIVNEVIKLVDEFFFESLQKRRKDDSAKDIYEMRAML